MGKLGKLKRRINNLTLPQKLGIGSIITAVLLGVGYFVHDKYFRREPEVLEPILYTLARKNMVENQVKLRDIYDKRVLDAMGNVPRHEFVIEEYLSTAYDDTPLPIGYGQTISQPYIVAYMTQSLKLKGKEKVLEIGTGSGYQSAVLDEIVDHVYSIEIIRDLAIRAEKTLNNLGYSVEVKNADGYYGWPEYAPFDAIMITAATNHIPSPLINQLSDNGKLIMPLGNPFFTQMLTLVEKKNNKLEMKQLLPVRFVPMTGRIQEEK